MANSKGKITLQPPPTLMQLASQKAAPKRKTIAQRDAEYRKALGIASGEAIPKKLGTGETIGASHYHTPVKKRKPPMKNRTKRARTTCLKCHKHSDRLRVGYCPKCLSN